MVSCKIKNSVLESPCICPPDLGSTNGEPAWSPDGKWIAYDNTDCGSAVTPLEENACGILIIDPMTSEKKWLVRGRMSEWISNDNFIYVGLNEDIYSFRFLDSSIKKIGMLSDDKACDMGNLKYSSQNLKIIFTGHFPNMQYSRIWAMNAEGSNLIQLTNDQACNCTWSRDGSKTVYNDSRGSNGRLWIMNADGSDKSQLTFPNRF